MELWNFPLRCEDGIHFVTVIVVETRLHPDEDFGEAHYVFILDSSSEEEARRPHTLISVSEPAWSTWETMSNWTRLD